MATIQDYAMLTILVGTAAGLQLLGAPNYVTALAVLTLGIAATALGIGESESDDKGTS